MRYNRTPRDWSGLLLFGGLAAYLIFTVAWAILSWA